jgi:hypothetical protein
VNNRGYIAMLTVLFFMTGMPSRLLAASLSAFCGAMSVVCTYRIGRSVFSEWVAVRAAWSLCFFPSMIIWSAQTIKEPLVIMLEAFALYGCLRLKSSGISLKYIPLTIISIFFIYHCRFYAAYITFASIMMALSLPRIKNPRASMGAALAGIAILLIIILASSSSRAVSSHYESFDLKYVEHFRSAAATGQGSSSGIQSHFDLHSPQGFLMVLAFGAAHLFLAPFPWQLGGASLRMVLTLPEMLVWWWLFCAGVVSGLVNAVRYRLGEIQPLLFFVIALSLLYSLLFGNIGLVFRQRAQILPCLLLFGMYGLERKRLFGRRGKKRRGPAARRMPQPGASPV